ncbi:uncharacterized protein LY79DRAFT_664975 [Colletotrichum navitas]|uniref:Uncharacterized protein n=1 Tax=Colletotrichum navitas TaxID=681940 RepID=A0AAD8QEP1_9PEZI|nr:uncharacterized protein LY79DRAFT_664975 [Colletotrichum navitas]KAK1600759.1 hypothetical protein LY79DRAFT_664975 [Colletotrichum navitas]
MLIFTLKHSTTTFVLIAGLAAGEPAFYVSAPALEVSDAPSPTFEATGIPSRIRAPGITPLEAQARVCNLEADYSPHDPIDPKKQEKGVSAFCDLLRGKGGYLEPGMESQRVEFQDANGGRHHYKVEWAAGCQTEVESQAIRRPLGHVGASLNCHDLMRENYLLCHNGGVGGKVQVGCLIYTYNGGIMTGRMYDW